jgi:hypothetical protein
MLALAPAAEPTASAREPTASPSSPAPRSQAASARADEGQPAAQGPARLVLGPDHRGTLTVVDEQGHEVAAVAMRPGLRTVVELPPGRYTLRDASGQALETLALEAGEARAASLPPAFHAPAPAKTPSTAPPVPRPVVTTGPLGPPSKHAQQEIELVRRRRWARWVAPLLSALIPGAGQAVNRQPGRGLAVFTGTASLVLGSVAVWAAGDPSNGASGNVDGGNAGEIVRLGAFAGLTTAAGLLYLGQILDAHAQAVDRRPPRPERDHVVSLEVSRFATVGFAAGRPAYDLYTDWSLAIMGQLAPRVSFGLSDISIKYARHRSMLTVQAGVRAAYRFFDRRRVWLAAGGGVLLQGTRADAALAPVSSDPTGPQATDAERAFSTVPYVHLDARLFLLDRWYLGLMPRVSVPLVARRFGSGLSLPRYATTFELGANIGVLF